MKLCVAFALTVALACSSEAHYIFSKLVINGEVSNDWQYIRQTTRSKAYEPTKFSNTYDDLTPNDSDFRCNLDSFTNAAKTEVAEVAAGDTIAMRLNYDATVSHPGPGQVYMSKAPSGNVKEYEGDGEWFKIWEKTLCNENGDLYRDAWCTYGLSEFEFKIPEDTPAGEYLVRAEHVGLHKAFHNEAEIFYSCAQIKVTGSGTGSPDITYKIPGIYNDTMKIFNGASIYTESASQILSDIKDSPIGDDVWTGGGTFSTSASSTPVPTQSATAKATHFSQSAHHNSSVKARNQGARKLGRRA
ncbi:glycosyl hydrolase family 61-domain-containing protein [Aspergillus avenaceus]|uniref:AA9 family lytic polysaccharide monooxygenase n=1 Tax=Aspergillus avenaceus TaxID=36643 RepID=A0A5N6U4S6_ASPAV|nr:glycosyl hydrolase family 61-domain-containing protein [Aspergillus avenaceus]